MDRIRSLASQLSSPVFWAINEIVVFPLPQPAIAAGQVK